MGGKGSGGRRDNAGRPKEIPTHKMTIRVTDHEHETLRQRAKAAGVTVTEFIKVRTLGGSDNGNT